MADISPNFISDIETGKRWLSSDTLVNLAAILSVDVFEFLKPEEAPANDVSGILTKYSEDASSILTKLVTQSLDNLRRQYLGE
jgi:transcriptional regulator with XRE-family HTH domain